MILRTVLALLAGLLQACSIAAPWNGQPLWWLQIASLAVLIALLQRSASPRQAAGLAWAFATSWLCGTVWWLFISMHVYGGLAAPLAVLAVLALCGFLGLYYAAAGYVYKRFMPPGQEGAARAALIFVACWLLAELARDSWFTGFPWGAGGYAHIDGPLAGLAPLVGVYGVGWVASWIAYELVQMIFNRARSLQQNLLTSLTVVLLGGIGLLGKFGDPIGEHYFRQSPTAITLLQGNIPQGEKFDARTGVKESLSWYRTQLLSATGTLVITPETAVPLLPYQLPQGYWEEISAHFQSRPQSQPQAALIGIPLGNFERGYTNSVLGLKPGAAQAYEYSKHHLVPFGEFIPPLFKWFTEMMNIPLGDFNRGALAQKSFDWAGQRWAPNICYEDLFGDELAARFVDESQAPTVMVNVSNIGWFGDTVAIDQHLAISRMRALELARPMLRATNTGATVIIDHRGQVTQSLPRYSKGVLQGQVQGGTGITPYAWWAGRFGLWPLWGLAFALLLIAVRANSAGAAARKDVKID